LLVKLSDRFVANFDSLPVLLVKLTDGAQHQPPADAYLVWYAGNMADSSAANVAINATPELPACFAPGDQGLLGLRLGGLFGILVVSTIGVTIPFFTYKAKLNSVYFLIQAFAAGVVLTTG